MRLSDAPLAPLVIFLKEMLNEYEDQYWETLATAARTRDPATVDEANKVKKQANAVNDWLSKLIMIAWPQKELDIIIERFTNRFYAEVQNPVLLVHNVIVAQRVHDFLTEWDKEPHANVV